MLPTLALKPRGDITRSQKNGHQWSHKKDLCPPKIVKNLNTLLSAILFKKKINILSYLFDNGPL